MAHRKLLGLLVPVREETPLLLIDLQVRNLEADRLVRVARKQQVLRDQDGECKDGASTLARAPSLSGMDFAGAAGMVGGRARKTNMITRAHKAVKTAWKLTVSETGEDLREMIFAS